MTFEQYLTGKKIDSEAFRAGEPAVWAEWKHELEQMHPNSFTAQKLYLINPVRRRYPLKVELTASDPSATTEPKPSPVAKPRPVFKPKVG